MRKSRLISLAAALLLVAAGWWAWSERDLVVPKFTNPLLEGARIESLHDLQLAPGRLAFRRMDLLLDNGARLRLRNVQLLRPFSLLSALKQNRAKLTIARLDYTPPAVAARQKPRPATAESPAAEGLKLGDSIKLLHRYLPEELRIRELVWGDLARGGKEPQSVRLNLHRDRNNQAVRAELSGGGQQLVLQLQLSGEHLEFSARMGEEIQPPALSVTGSLKAENSDRWSLAAQLKSDLRQVGRLPLTADLGDIAANATGTLSASVETQIPDRLLLLREYRDFAATLQGDSVQITLPGELLGTAIQVSLSTSDPVAIALDSLQPLRPEGISGSGVVELTPPGQPRPLLRTRFGTATRLGIPLLEATGDLNLEAADPLLKIPRWKRRFEPFALDSAAGTVHFRATAELKSLDKIRDSGHSWLSDVHLTLLPKSRASVAVAATGKDDSLPGQIGWSKGRVEIQFPEEATLDAARWPGGLRLAGKSMELRAAGDSGALSFDARFNEIDCSIAEETTCALKLDANLSGLELNRDKLAIRKPSLTADVQLLLQDNLQQWQFRQVTIAAEQIGREEAKLNEPALRSPLLECTLANGESTCRGDTLTGSFAGIESAQVGGSGSIQFDDFQFKRVGDETLARANFSSDGLNLQAQQGYSLDAELNGNVELNGDALRGESRIRAGTLDLQSRWRHKLDSGEGGAEFTLAETEFSQRQPLSQSIEGLPLDLVAGAVSAEGNYSWPQPQGDTIRLSLERVAAVYGENFAVGAAGQVSLHRRGEQWVTREPQSLRLDTLDVGLPIQNIRFTLALDGKRDLTLGDVSAELLGGELRSPQLLWNLDGEERRSQVLVSDISLGELARQMEAENFAASGILDLRIPLVTGPDGITVEAGQVEAQPPGGRLRYYGAFSADMLSSNPQLKLLAGALEDYNFRELSGTLDYPPSGDMQLQLKLVGRSESVAADRDLIINLNLENNIPAMLSSLQASRNLTEALEKQL